MTQDHQQRISALGAVVGHIRRGWAVIAIHGVDPETGSCTCGRSACASPGKHPVKKGWVNEEALSVPDAHEIWGEGSGQARHYNVGVLTGERSGMFVLDIDPKGGGDEALARLLIEHGPFPRTVTARTGSGGEHYYFAMPEFDIRNSVRRVAEGIDVRANGGQVVAPPSVSGVGSYSWTTDPDTPIAEAPEWLLDMLRPSAAQLAVAEEPVVHADGLPDVESLPDAVRTRVERYARAAVASEADLYANAPAGGGNDALFTAACNCFEIAQSPWNSVTADDVADVLEAARLRRAKWRQDGGQDPVEFSKTVASARSKVVGRGRKLPPDRSEGSAADGFAAADWGAGGADETGQTAIFTSDDPVESLFRMMHRRSEYISIAPPKRLIQGFLSLDSEAWMIGPPGGFKSFVALDMALHVASGKRWRERPTEKGPVLYIAGEGGKGVVQRIRAWEQFHGAEAPEEDFRLLSMPVQAGRWSDWDVLVKASMRLRPVLVVIDTQARMTVGLDENSAKDMGMYVDAVRKLRANTEACVLTVHHVGRDGGDARGSSALDAAQDTEIRVKRPPAHGRGKNAALEATVSLDKQKDGSDSESESVKLEAVTIGTDPDTGLDVSSLVITPVDVFAQPVQMVPEHIARLNENQQDLFTVLRDHADNERGATAAELIRFVKETRGRAMPHNCAGSALKSLVKKRLIVRDGARYVLAEHHEEAA